MGLHEVSAIIRDYSESYLGFDYVKDKCARKNAYMYIQSFFRYEIWKNVISKIPEGHILIIVHF